MNVRRGAPSKERVRLGTPVGATLALAAVLIIGLGGCEGSADSDLVPITAPIENVDPTIPSSSTTSTRPPTSVTINVATAPTLPVTLPAEGPTFGEETGVLLLFDDGVDGLTAVDPDRRLAGRSVVEGQHAGDEAYSMIRVGDKLVVGWHEPHAVDVATRQGQSLGHATMFIPAAEPDRVWMVDSGSRIGSAPVRVWQVDVVTGEAIHDPIPLGTDRHALIGIEGGLALQTDSSLSLWTLDDRQVVSLASTHSAFAHDVSDNHLVWCSSDCTTLSVTDTDSLDTQQFSPPDGYDSFAYESQLSADGRYLAALVRQATPPGATGMWILDRDTNQTQVVSDPETDVSFLTWAPDSSQLFATSDSYGTTRTVVWRYQIPGQEFEAVVLPFGGALRAVVVDDDVANAYIPGEPVEASQCRRPSVQPSDKSAICVFRY